CSSDLPSPSRKARRIATDRSGEVPPSNPTTGIAIRWARAASGQAVVLPTSLINCRRRMCLSPEGGRLPLPGRDASGEDLVTSPCDLLLRRSDDFRSATINSAQSAAAQFVRNVG